MGSSLKDVSRKSARQTMEERDREKGGGDLGRKEEVRRGVLRPGRCRTSWLLLLLSQYKLKQCALSFYCALGTP